MEQRRRHGKSHTADDGGRSSSSSSRSRSSSSSGGDSDGGSPASPTGGHASSDSQQGPSSSSGNAFANDGSFMEMFKKKMEAEMKKAQGTDEEQGHKKPPPVTSFVGKRRGGVFLKTGMVAKKQKQDTEATPGKSDAWSKYMAEVKKYKAHQCGDDDKTRPLVK
ncbi:telomerase RNA component interacting RNase [Syngnathoides biaculeatus]|uniref:telomerase RNA component interacting RNase n=1 Tax=Syngnathoides biaculeatus TaxID=300417 RepID=UPI002ADE4416|nr:telomerase RNA component interacting RNase [Syngnathoides biaculeatus]